MPNGAEAPSVRDRGGIAPFLARLRAAVPMADRRREDGLPPRGIVAVFLGDSITAGWREWGVLQPETAYPALWAQAVRHRYRSSALSVINAGLGGSTAADGLSRFQRDVLTHRPDLVVICYGLNDAGVGAGGPAAFGARIARMVQQARRAGAACIYLTPNPIYTPGIPDDHPHRDYLHRAAAWTEPYLDAGRRAALDAGAAVADGYARWLRQVQELHDGGPEDEESADAGHHGGQGNDPGSRPSSHPALLPRNRDFLSNGLHHPNDAGHRILAEALLETTFSP